MVHGLRGNVNFIPADDCFWAADSADRQFDVRKILSWKNKRTQEEVLLVQHHAQTQAMAHRLGDGLDELVEQIICEI